jgi:hypothetical protein
VIEAWEGNCIFLIPWELLECRVCGAFEAADYLTAIIITIILSEVQLHKTSDSFNFIRCAEDKKAQSVVSDIRNRLWSL